VAKSSKVVIKPNDSAEMVEGFNSYELEADLKLGAAATISAIKGGGRTG